MRYVYICIDCEMMNIGDAEGGSLGFTDMLLKDIAVFNNVQ